MDPPKRVKIELEEEDVRGDISKAIKSMSRIRSEVLSNNTSTRRQEKQYFRLTYRLASGIYALANEKLVDKIEKIVESMNENESLIWYDHSQENYWKNNDKDFSKTLDEIVISIFRDNLSSFESKQHVLQAIKFLGVLDESHEEKKRIYNSIKPCQGRVRTPKRRASLLFKKFAGYSYKIKNSDEFRLSVRGDISFINGLIKQARYLGYDKLEMDMFSQDFYKIKEKFPNSRIIDSRIRKFLFDFIKILTEHIHF
jgi:hypothetical protein